MTLFFSSQLRTFWTNSAQLSAHDRFQSLWKLSREMLFRHVSATTAPLVGQHIAENEKLTVILLNHKRPKNVGMIARYALRCGFVGKVIISNNSQDYPIENYVKTDDPRLLLLNHKQPSGVGISFELAREYPARYYVRIDDDIFLHPAQLQWIYWNLRQAPQCPHGIFGAARDQGHTADKKWPFVHVRNSRTTVDILNGLFAFTHEHLEEYFRLCILLGITDQRTLMNGEDIVLSFAGSQKPLIHNIGMIWECTSASIPGVALHMSRPRFFEERWRIFSELEKIKPFDDDIEHVERPLEQVPRI